MIVTIVGNIVKPVLWGHLWDKEKVAIQDKWPLKRGSIHMKFSMTGQLKGDLSIQVTTWAGLTVNFFFVVGNKMTSINVVKCCKFLHCGWTHDYKSCNCSEISLPGYYTGVASCVLCSEMTPV